MRGVYEKVEQRIAYGAEEKSSKHGQDFKRKWRVKRAKQELVERFGLLHIRRVAAYSAVLVVAVIALLVVEATGYSVFTKIYAFIISSIDAAVAAIASLVGAVALVVPSFKLAFASKKESSVSRGEVIFKQASTIRDELGFLEKVKRELQALFAYLHQFEEQIGTKIVIVPIVDDLDRCITDGRNVKVLEAMQLILSVPGAPILSFLAVDSRIVVASIEEHYEKVFAKTNISGHEYLDKIVQIPFAIPEPAPDKLERMLSKALEGDAASPAQVAQRLKVFGTHGRHILTQTGSNKVTFKIMKANVSHEDVVHLPLEPLILVIENSWGNTGDKKLELDSKQALELVCSAAGTLGSDLKELADRLTGTKQSNVYKEEAIEILCRETNLALEAGQFGFEEVHTPLTLGMAFYRICISGYCIIIGATIPEYE